MHRKPGQLVIIGKVRLASGSNAKQTGGRLIVGLDDPTAGGDGDMDLQKILHPVRYEHGSVGGFIWS